MGADVDSIFDMIKTFERHKRESLKLLELPSTKLPEELDEAVGVLVLTVIPKYLLGVARTANGITNLRSLATFLFNLGQLWATPDGQQQVRALLEKSDA